MNARATGATVLLAAAAVVAIAVLQPFGPTNAPAESVEPDANPPSTAEVSGEAPYPQLDAERSPDGGPTALSADVSTAETSGGDGGRGQKLEGFVRSAGGSALFGAIVCWSASGVAPNETVRRETVRSGADGSYRLSVGEGGAVRASAVAHHSDSLVLERQRTPRQHDFELTPREDVYGVIVDAATGEPLVHWSVRQAPLAEPETITDEQGRFRLPFDAAADSAVAVAPPGERVEIFVPWELEDGGSLKVRVATETSDRSRVRVRVLDSDGRPYEWVEVRLFQRHGPGRFEFASLGEVAEDGFYVSSPLPPGVYRAQLESAEFAPPLPLGSFELVAGTDRDLGTVRGEATGRLVVALARTDQAELQRPLMRLFDARGREFFGPQVRRDGGLRVDLRTGSYRVDFACDNAEWRSGSVAIQAGRETRLEWRSLRPAQRRAIEFPLPRPAGWPASSTLRWEIRDASDRLVARSETADHSWPLRFEVALAVGVHRVLAEAGDGRWLGSFEIEALETTRIALPVAMKPLEPAQDREH